MTEAEAFRQGVQAYRQDRWEDAVADLASPARRPDLLGRLARHYQGRAHYQAALALARGGRLYDALNRLRQARSILGDRADLATLLAGLCHAAGSDDRAEAQLQEAGGGGDGAARIEADLADLQIRTGRPELAMLTLHDALRRFPEDPWLNLKMGLMLARQEQYLQARTHLRRCVEVAPDLAEGHYWLGMCEAAVDAPAAAVASLGRAHALRPERIVWAWQLALAARAATQRGLSVELPLTAPAAQVDRHTLAGLAERIAADSDIVMALLSLPASDADEELFAVLSGVLELALERHRERADLHHRQALVLDRLGRPEEAIEQARAAVAIEPRFVQAHILLGSLLCQREPQAAEAHLRQAIAAGGDYADVRVRLAGLAEQAGQAERARTELKRALEINVNYREARQALERLAA